MTKQFVDKSELLDAKLMRSQYAIVHGDKVITASYVTDLQKTLRSAATPPTGRIQMYSTGSGLFALASQNSNTEWALYRSPDGIEDFVEVLRDTRNYAGGYQTALCDCGDDRLFYLDYTSIEETSKIFYSADGGVNWGDNAPDYNDGDPIMTTEIGAIRHFHGARYDADYGRLYVFTGDSDDDASILWCGDIDDLLANPLTWRDRWGLSDATRSTLDDDYVVGKGDQKWRCLDIGFSGDWIYHGSDTLSGGQEIARFHRQTHEKQSVYVHTHGTHVTAGTASGEVWAWGNASDGTLLMAGSAAQSTLAGTDGYMHIYALDGHEGRVMREIHRVERTDGHASAGVAIPHGIYAYGDYVIISYRLRLPNVLGKIVNAPSLPPIRPEYDGDEQAALIYGSTANAAATYLGCGIWDDSSQWVIFASKLSLRPGRYTLGRFYTRVMYTQAADCDEAYVAVMEVADGKASVVAAVDGTRLYECYDDVGGITGASAFVYPEGLQYDFEAGKDYYFALYYHRPEGAGANRPGLKRNNSGEGPQGEYFVYKQPGERPETDIDVTIGSASQPQFSTIWSTAERTVYAQDAPAIGESFSVPRIRDHDMVVKLSDVVVEDGNSLAIELQTAVDGDESTVETIVLDMGATDRVSVGTTHVNLNGVTSEAGDTFDIAIIYREESEKLNVLWRNKTTGQGLSATDYITIAHGAKSAATRGTEYAFASSFYWLKLTGTATVGKLQVGWEPLVMIGDEQVSVADSRLAAHLPTAMTRNRIVWEDWAPNSKWTASTTDLTAGYLRYKHTTPGSGDVCELAAGLLVICGPGVHDLADIVDEDELADRVELATDHAARTAEILQDWNTHANTTVHSGAIIVGLPPYSERAARHSQVRTIVDQLNPMLRGVALASRATYVNPFPSMALSPESPRPEFRGSADGVLYASGQSQDVASMIVSAYERGASGMWLGGVQIDGLPTAGRRPSTIDSLVRMLSGLSVDYDVLVNPDGTLEVLDVYGRVLHRGHQAETIHWLHKQPKS